MAVSSRRYIRVPPDSTGKRAAAGVVTYLSYNNLVVDFEVGETLVGGTSGISAEILEVSDQLPTTTGTLTLLLEAAYEDSDWTLSENLLVNAVTKATAADTGEQVYLSQIQIVGGNNPRNIQSIDARGAQNTRFSEGAPQFDAFGRLRVSQTDNLKTYSFEHIDAADDYSLLYSGSATAS